MRETIDCDVQNHKQQGVVDKSPRYCSLEARKDLRNHRRNRGIFVSRQAAAAISHVKSALESFDCMVKGSDDREFAVKGGGGGG